MTSFDIAALQKSIDQDTANWLNDLKTFLRFETVSAKTDTHPAMNACISWLENFLKEIGFTVEIWPTSGYPVLYASYEIAERTQPTLLIYNHYDVQPAEPLARWDSNPFEAVIKGDHLYARGAQDNKGQCFYVLYALKLLFKEYGSLPMNIKLCIEGEEEIGSPGLAGLLEEKKESLKADYLAVVDLGIKAPHCPAITLGIRGIVTFDLAVTTARFDAHSGSHGGVLLNSLDVIVKLLASLKDKEGKITIPGFYDGVEEMSPDEKETLHFDFDLEQYQKEMGGKAVGGEKNYSALERGWIRPTVEINGISGGYTEEGFKTIIPAKAIAKLSCRLVPGQNPDRIKHLMKIFFEKKAPLEAKVELVCHPGEGQALRVSASSPLVNAFAKAYEKVFDAPCKFILEGGSIPIASRLKQVSQAEVVLMGLGLSSDQIHAPNEHFGIDRFKKGVLIMAYAITELSLPTTTAAHLIGEGKIDSTS